MRTQSLSNVSTPSTTKTHHKKSLMQTTGATRVQICQATNQSVTTDLRAKSCSKLSAPVTLVRREVVLRPAGLRLHAKLWPLLPGLTSARSQRAAAPPTGQSSLWSNLRLVGIRLWLWRTTARSRLLRPHLPPASQHQKPSACVCVRKALQANTISVVMRRLRRQRRKTQPILSMPRVDAQSCGTCLKNSMWQPALMVMQRPTRTNALTLARLGMPSARSIGRRSRRNAPAIPH